MNIESDRKVFEEWYASNATDYVVNPIGSRDCDLQWRAWQEARNYSALMRQQLQGIIQRECAKTCVDCHADCDSSPFAIELLRWFDAQFGAPQDRRLAPPRSNDPSAEQINEAAALGNRFAGGYYYAAYDELPPEALALLIAHVRKQAYEKAAKVCEFGVHRASERLDGNSFYIALGVAAKKIRALGTAHEGEKYAD